MSQGSDSSGALTIMRYKYLLPITVVFAASLLICDTIGSKIFHVGSLNLTAGTILFPLTFLAGDALTEVYGYAVTRKVIWSSLAGLLLMICTYEIARLLPPAEFWHNQEAFDTVLSHVPRIVLGSVTAYLCGEFTNSFIVAKMKVLTNGKSMAARFILSTVVGQLIDSIVFVTIALAGIYSLDAMINIILSIWIVKVAWEILALPISLPFVRWLKQQENEDYYDKSTDFNPFKV